MRTIAGMTSSGRAVAGQATLVDSEIGADLRLDAEQRAPVDLPTDGGERDPVEERATSRSRLMVRGWPGPGVE